MTNLTIYPVRIYTDNSKPDAANHRLSVIRWKTTKENPKPHAALCVSVPVAEIKVEPAILAKSLVAAFQDLQDAAIRDYIENYEGGIDTCKAIPDSTVSVDGVANFASREAESKRLSSTLLENWFNQYVADNLLLALANKQGISDNPTDEQLAMLNKTIETTRKVVTSLASPRSNYPENTVHQLQKVVALATDASAAEVRNQLETKLSKLLEPAKVSIELGL